MAKSVESHFSHFLPFVVGANQVGLGIGYRYGRSYSLSFAQITLELTVVVPTSAGGGAVSKGLQMVPDGFGVLQIRSENLVAYNLILTCSDLLHTF